MATSNDLLLRPLKARELPDRDAHLSTLGLAGSSWVPARRLAESGA
jgi:hypothetical protein